eukprot:605247_1
MAKKRIPLFAELKQILQSAHQYCQMGVNGKLTTLDIVEKVVILMEHSPFFNCGKGSVFNKDGKHEMEASIMNGKDLKCGAVSGLTNIKNPISVAHDIMNTTNHIYLIGKGATQHIQNLLLNTQPQNYYEAHQRTPPSFENNEYFWTEKRWNAYQKVKMQNLGKAIRSEDEDKLIQSNSPPGQQHDGADDDIFEGNTVGCVVMLKGNVAAATSTGGMTYKLNGRVGDTPIIGAGTYADNKFGAISCTGNGEEFMRHVTAYDIIARVKYCKISLEQAIKDHLNECFEPGTGGAVAVNSDGVIGIGFNSTGMIRGHFDSHCDSGYVGVMKDDIQSVSLNQMCLD